MTPPVRPSARATSGLAAEMFLIGVALVYGPLLANLLAPSRARLDALEHAVRRLLRPHRT